MSDLGTVIIVPGIGGCELSTQPTLFGLGSPVRIWMNPTAMVAGGWRLLGLGPDGLTPDVPLTGNIVPGLPLPGYYDQLTQMLTLRGWRVVGCKLDWRQAWIYDAARLVSLIVAESEERPVHLVAHSRGGLVARAAIDQLTALGELGRLGWCVGLGVPHQGSWEAAGLLAAWNQTALLLTNILDRSASLLSAGLVNLRLRAVLISWPSTYELLPSPLATGVSPDEIGEIYDPTTWELSDRAVSANWLSRANSVWRGLTYVPTGVDWVDFVGTGFTTPDRLYIPAKLASGQGWAWSPLGDGVVPARWATQPGRRKVTCPTSHGAMVYDGRVVAVIDQVLRGGLSEDVVISGPLLA